MPSVIKFSVRGIPIGQGAISSSFRNGHSWQRHTNQKTLYPWRDLVGKVAQKYSSSPLWDGPLAMTLDFGLAWPKSALKGPCVCHDQISVHKLKDGSRSFCKRQGCGCKGYVPSDFPAKFPDLDHLVRAIGDSLKGIIYKDDAQIVSLAAHKRYSTEPGVKVEVKRLW